MKELDKSILRDLYVFKKKSCYEIAELLNTSFQEVEKYLDLYDIAKNPKQRKFEHLIGTPFTEDQKEFIIGSLIRKWKVRR